MISKMKDKTKKSVLQIVIIIIVIIIIGHSAANKVRIISPLPSASYDFKKLGIISWVTQVIKNMTSEDKNNKIRILSTNIPDLKTNNNKKYMKKIIIQICLKRIIIQIYLNSLLKMIL